MYKPRKYQEPGIQSCIEILTSKTPRKEIVVSPTAGGKSLYVAFAAKHVDFPLIILQPSKELLEQNYKKFIQLGGEADIYSASMKTLNIGRVTFATIGSIISKIDEVKKLGVKAIIIDEVHIGTQSDSQIRRFITACGITNVLGLTATPVYLKNGLNGAELKMMTKVKGAMFKNIAHVTQIQELVRDGYWSKLNYTIHNPDKKFLVENSNGSDYTLDSQKEFYQENNLNKKIRIATDQLIQLGRKSILIFVPSIEEAEELTKTIPGSRCVHSKMKSSERDEVVKGFTTLKIKVVINVNVLSVGFDHPELDAIITARSTMSIAMYYQQIGRGVRIHDLKEYCDVVDFSGNYSKFGAVEDLNFHYIDGYGWGMFTKDSLLTNYPMAAKTRPTKDSLVKGVERKRKQVFQIKGYEAPITTKLWFGKYKDRTLESVHKENANYLPWVYENFDFQGDKMKKLKTEIKTILNL